MIVVVMGVSGSGKTTIGTLLAERLGWQFADADAFHSPENIAKMRSGVPLNDADRQPWLQRLGAQAAEWSKSGTDVVLACSALRDAYRQIIGRDATDLRWVFLEGSRELIAQRLTARDGHFMPSSLLESQFQTLEEPVDAVKVDIAQTPEAIVQEIMQRLGLLPRAS